jgi:hypothetical protein
VPQAESESGPSQPAPPTCTACGLVLPSRTQLFAHLRAAHPGVVPAGAPRKLQKWVCVLGVLPDLSTQVPSDDELPPTPTPGVASLDTTGTTVGAGGGAPGAASTVLQLLDAVAADGKSAGPDVGAGGLTVLPAARGCSAAMATVCAFNLDVGALAPNADAAERLRLDVLSQQLPPHVRLWAIAPTVPSFNAERCADRWRHGFLFPLALALPPDVAAKHRASGDPVTSNAPSPATEQQRQQEQESPRGPRWDFRPNLVDECISCGVRFSADAQRSLCKRVKLVVKRLVGDYVSLHNLSGGVPADAVRRSIVKMSVTGIELLPVPQAAGHRDGGGEAHVEAFVRLWVLSDLHSAEVLHLAGLAIAVVQDLLPVDVIPLVMGPKAKPRRADQGEQPLQRAGAAGDLMISIEPAPSHLLFVSAPLSRTSFGSDCATFYTICLLPPCHLLLVRFVMLLWCGVGSPAVHGLAQSTHATCLPDSVC